MIRQDRKTKLPKSDAKTAYVLLSDIIRLSMQEPKRMRMDSWSMQWFGNDGPPCGTVGCIGGWTEVLRPNSRAGATLRLTEDQKQELFFGQLCEDRSQGTLRHAKRVAAHIRRFQRRNSAQLKATRV